MIVNTMCINFIFTLQYLGGGPPTPIDFVSQKVLEAIAPEVKEGLSSSQNEAGLGVGWIYIFLVMRYVYVVLWFKVTLLMIKNNPLKHLCTSHNKVVEDVCFLMG